MVHLDRDPNALANTVLHNAPEESVEVEAVEEPKDEKPAAKPSGLSSQSASALLGDRKVNE